MAGLVRGRDEEPGTRLQAPVADLHRQEVAEDVGQQVALGGRARAVDAELAWPQPCHVGRGADGAAGAHATRSPSPSMRSFHRVGTPSASQPRMR